MCVYCPLQFLNCPRDSFKIISQRLRRIEMIGGFLGGGRGNHRDTTGLYFPQLKIVGSKDEWTWRSSVIIDESGTVFISFRYDSVAYGQQSEELANVRCVGVIGS